MLKAKRNRLAEIEGTLKGRNAEYLDARRRGGASENPLTLAALKAFEENIAMLEKQASTARQDIAEAESPSELRALVKELEALELKFRDAHARYVIKWGDGSDPDEDPEIADERNRQFAVLVDLQKAIGSARALAERA